VCQQTTLNNSKKTGTPAAVYVIIFFIESARQAAHIWDGLKREGEE